MGRLIGRAQVLVSTNDAARVRLGGEADGGPVLIHGPAGSGRTATLRAVLDTLATPGEAGPHVLRAQGLGRDDVAMGVVRRLLHRLAPDETPATATGEIDPYGAALTVARRFEHAAEDRGLVVGIDDIDRSDDASRRTIALLADLPGVCLIATATTATALGLNWFRVEELAPLDHHDLAELLAAITGSRPLPSLVAAVEAATAGLPGLAVPLLDTLVAAGRGGPDDSGVGVEDLAVPAAPAHLAARLARLPEGATAMAEAAAILGAGVRLDVLAAAAGMGVHDASTGLADLIDAGLMAVGTPHEWRASLIGAAARSLVTPGQTSAIRHRAAAAMARAGDPAEETGATLLDTLPVGEPWAATSLQGAAVAAAARGAPELAGRLWRRLLEEPLGFSDRAWAEAGLARTELQVGDPAGIERLRRLAPRVDDPTLRALARFAAARALLWDGRGVEAAEEFEAAAADAAAADATLAGRAHAGAALARAITLTAGESTPEANYGGRPAGSSGNVPLADAPLADAPLADAPLADAPLADASLADASLAGARALVLATQGAPAAAVEAAAVRCFADRRILEGPQSDNTAVGAAATALASAGCPDAALSALEVPVAAARRTGALSTEVTLRSVAATALLAAGRVGEARTLARSALDGPGLYPLERPAVVAVLVHTALAAGDADEADALVAALREFDDRGDPNRLASLRLTAARAATALHRGDTERALALADGLLDAPVGRGVLGSEPVAIVSLIRSGRREEAVERAELLIEAEADQAPDRRGRAMVLAGQAAGDLDRIRAGTALTTHGANQVIHVESLITLGRALARHGSRTTARTRLREALDLATSIEADGLAAAALAALREAGGRLRNRTLHGVGALTPAEERVVRRVAAGGTNRAVADDLYLSRRTVEFHLGNAYAKLGTPHREELADLLAAHDEQAATPRAT